MNVSPSSQAATSSYPGNVLFSRRKRRNLSATQLLWAKLERTAARAALLRGQSNPNDKAVADVFAQCEARLGMARACLDRQFRQTWTFWELIHRVDELLLLVTPDDMLVAEANDVWARFDQKIKDPVLRKVWLGPDDKSGPLPKVIQRLSDATPTSGGGAPSPHDPLPSGDRHILRNALNLVNEQGDANFWRLGSNVSVQSMSAVILVLLFILGRGFFGSSSAAADSRPNLVDIVMLGAGGAIVSNMIAKKPFIVSIGPTSRYFAFNLFVKPVLGAFVALFMYFLEQSGLVFTILTDQSASSNGAALIVVSPIAATFLRSVIALAAGFFGERLLRPMMDKVLRVMSAQGEKVATTPVASEQA